MRDGVFQLIAVCMFMLMKEPSETQFQALPKQTIFACRINVLMLWSFHGIC